MTNQELLEWLEQITQNNIEREDRLKQKRNEDNLTIKRQYNLNKKDK